MYTYERPVLKSIKNENNEIHMVEETSIIKQFDHSSIYRSKAFTEAMNSYFDIEDKMTRNVLLSVNEEDQNLVMTALSNKLYKMIIDKVDQIDFGTIPSSKGDITKIDNHDQLVDCMNILSDILVQYHQSTESIGCIRMAYNNILDRRDMFTKAYALNVEFPMVTYNTFTLAVVSSISYMISSCIEFVKLPGDSGFEIALDKAAVIKSKDALLFKDLYKFNNMCANGSLDKAMEYIMNMNAKNFTGVGFALGAGSVAAVLGIILLIIPTIRELIFLFYYMRNKISNYFDVQSALLTQNAYNIENNLSRDDKSKKEIANKQKKIADQFKKASNAFRVNMKTAESKTASEVKKADSDKYKYNDVLDKIPDSSNSVLF